MPEYYCRRIQSQVMAEKSEDVTGKIYVQCKHYTEGKNPCIKNSPKFKKCLVQLAVQREAKEKSRLVS